MRRAWVGVMAGVMTLAFLACNSGSGGSAALSTTSSISPTPTTAPTTAPTSPAPSSTAATSTTSTTAPPIRWTGAVGACDNAPPPAVQKTWQVSAPRDTVTGNSAVQVGLRNKFGAAGETYNLTVVVVTPDQKSTSTRTVLTADNFAYLNYPTDFAGAPTTFVKGNYTILWSEARGFLACDGFGHA